jgi:diguanylate cyclase (GGDEF)-like protein
MNASNADDKATVLVVDDTPANLVLLSSLLNDDYKVRVANNGEKALTIASETHPDLILLDIMMPDMDGYEVCRRLQSNPQTRHIPIIFVSAKSEMEDEKKGLDLGAVDYISKPFRIAIVKARVRAHIRSKRQSDLFESMAMLDGLTHIPNRRRFDEILDAEWQRSCREHTSLALLMIDIDFFKLYNDHYGHTMGDACLVQVAEILTRIVNRPGDLAARYGGEEFVAVLPNTDTEGARHLAQQFRTSVDALLIPHADSSIADHLTVSIGFAAARCSERISADKLLNCADHWLYQAKHDGRNLVEGGIYQEENCHE